MPSDVDWAVRLLLLVKVQDRDLHVAPLGRTCLDLVPHLPIRLANNSKVSKWF